MRSVWWGLIALVIPLLAAPVAAASAIVEQSKLVPAPPVDELIADDDLGRAVAIDGNFCAVGVQADYTGFNTGAVQVFHLAGMTWVHRVTLLPTQYQLSGNLGVSVAIDDDTIVAGAPREGDSGAVYVFRDTSPNGTWSTFSTVRITSPLVSEGAQFGSSVSIAGDILVVGAPLDESGGVQTGSAILLHDTSGSWSSVSQTRLASATLAQSADAGSSVAAFTGMVVVGAPDDDGLIADSGAVYLYLDTSAGGDWSSVAEVKIVSADGAAYDDFGAGVSFDGTTLAAGAPRHDAAGSSYGAVYLFRDSSASGNWSSVSEAKLLPSTTTRYLGGTVSLKETTLAAGGGRRSSTGTWIVFEDTSPTGDWSTVSQTPMVFDTGADVGEQLALSWDQWVIAGAPADATAGHDAGAAVLYNDAGGWHQQQVLTVTGLGDHGGVGFGSDVAVIGTTLGASVLGSNGSLGRIELYGFDGAWSPLQTVMSATAEYSDFFGWSLSLEDGVLVTGTPYRTYASVLVFTDESASGDWGSFSETALTPTFPELSDRLGWQVALQGRTIVAGAPRDDEVAPYAGAIYIFRDTSPSGDWTTYTDTKITASDGAYFDSFGYAVALDGRTIVAGTQLYSAPGAAYVLQDTSPAGDWSSHTETRVSASDGAGYDHFGTWWVAASGDTVAIAATGADANGEDSGAVYLYHDASGLGLWDQADEIKLIDPQGGPGEGFGTRGDLQGSVLVVGAPGNSSAAVDGGAVVVYQDVSHTGNWSNLLVSTASPTDCTSHDSFGSSAAVDGTTLVVGSVWSDDSGPDNGAVYTLHLSLALFVDGFETGNTSNWSHGVR